jgi:xylulokinase
VPLVLGVASGAGGTAVEARDADTGRLVATGAVPHRPARDGREQSAIRWWDALVDAIAACGRGGDVAALGVGGQRQALVLLDGAGAPIARASLRTDDRAAQTAAALVERLQAAKLARATGHVPRSDTPLARLAWLYRRDASLAASTESVLGAAEFLVFRLTGRRVADRGSASGTGWFDPGRGTWRPDLLGRAVSPAPGVGWPAALPTVLGPTEAADRVSATIHGLAGLPARPLVAAGTGDLMARAVAAGLGPGAVAVLADPDDTVAVAVVDEPTADETGRVQGFADATGNHLPTVAAPPIGPSLDAIARLLGTDGAGLAALAGEALTPVADDPVLLAVAPAGPGERAPAHPGAIVGLTADLSPEALARAALHGAAAALLDAVDLVGGDHDVLVLAGADAARPGIAEAVATLSGRPVRLARPLPNPVATGAAVQAAAALAGADLGDVSVAWGLDGGAELEPGDLDRDGVLERIRAASMEQHETA